ncbi:KH domain-containing protein [Candidatus Microgenomates bacterium]|nr:KH domain-containing protein [Candidatus Microgenomates bacterium]MBI2622032.1 KH domain-containing protein [Candidatus Microgenomates bacterium]
MEKTLEFIVKAIVQKTEQITIAQDEVDGIINLNLTVAKDDMGRIIGKNGKIIKAIRNVLRIQALKEGKRVNLTLVEA